MFLNVINPVGIASSVDLAGLPLWRIELARWSAPRGDVAKNPVLGLVLRYVIGAATVEGAGKTVTQIVHLVGIDSGTGGDELADAVAQGFPHVERAENRAAMKESLGMLHNVMEKAGECDAFIERALALVDLRHDFLEALWKNRAADNLLTMGPRWAATFEGYRCALVTGRFDPWLSGPVLASALGAPPADPPKAVTGKKGKGAPPAAVL